MATASKGSVLAAPRISVGARLTRPRETGIPVALVIMAVVLATAAPEFRSPGNLLNDSRNSSLIGMIPIGEAMVMITGGIDLSAGSVWGVTEDETAGTEQVVGLLSGTSRRWCSPSDWRPSLPC